MKDYSLAEQGIMVGIGDLSNDHEALVEKISLQKFRMLISNVLMLQPMIKPIEKHIVYAITKENAKSMAESAMKNAMRRTNLFNRDKGRA